MRSRLAWRWKESGVSGSGPWTHRIDVVKDWLHSLEGRFGERIEHWVEVDEEDPAARSTGGAEVPTGGQAGA